MRIAIIGAGAMGSLYGGYLARSGHDVFLLDTWAVHVRQINQAVLKIDEIYHQCLNVAAATSANQSSMLQDILRRRPTEIRRLNGRVADLAQKAGLPVPYNQVVCQLILALEGTLGLSGNICTKHSG